MDRRLKVTCHKNGDSSVTVHNLSFPYIDKEKREKRDEVSPVTRVPLLHAFLLARE
jgi:hypothetical protein